MLLRIQSCIFSHSKPEYRFNFAHFPWIFCSSKSLSEALGVLCRTGSFHFWMSHPWLWWIPLVLPVCVGFVALQSLFREIIHLSGREHLLSLPDNKLVLPFLREIKRDIPTQRDGAMAWGWQDQKQKEKKEKRKKKLVEEWLQNLSDLLQQLIHQGNLALPHSNLNWI